MGLVDDILKMLDDSIGSLRNMYETMDKENVELDGRKLSREEIEEQVAVFDETFFALRDAVSGLKGVEEKIRKTDARMMAAIVGRMMDSDWVIEIAMKYPEILSILAHAKKNLKDVVG